jgi:hypothetical protein
MKIINPDKPYSDIGLRLRLGFVESGIRIAHAVLAMWTANGLGIVLEGVRQSR